MACRQNLDRLPGPSWAETLLADLHHLQHPGGGARPVYPNQQSFRRNVRRQAVCPLAVCPLAAYLSVVFLRVASWAERACHRIGTASLMAETVCRSFGMACRVPETAGRQMHCDHLPAGHRRRQAYSRA